MSGEISQNKYDKGLKGEKYIASKISELGFKVLYIGGCQLYNITGDKFYSVDLEPFGYGKTFWVQAKYKEPRTHYPDTGMELWRYGNLVKHEKESGLSILVLFTDNSQKIYGEWLRNLPKCLSNLGSKINKQTGDEMTYWLLEKLRDYKELLTDMRL